MYVGKVDLTIKSKTFYVAKVNLTIKSKTFYAVNRGST